MLMLNVVARRFSILGQIFWPQDMALFAVALLLYFTGIMVFTAAYGRLWCGWVCPQTLFMEMVFRKHRIRHRRRLPRATRPGRRALDGAAKSGIKLAKHALFFGLSFVISNLLLAYIIGIDQLFQIVTDSPARHLEGLAYDPASPVFYAIFARFREQACTFICPYGRFQSTVLDENTIVVAYDYKRGEQRAGLARRQSPAQRRPRATGDWLLWPLMPAAGRTTGH